MSKERECPICGEWMTYQEGEPDVGLEGGWECDECEHIELEELDNDIDLEERKAG